MITYPNLATSLLYDVLQRCVLYLNRSVAALELEDLEASGSTFPFTLNPILPELDGGRYIGLILPGTLMDLLAGRRPISTRSGGGGGKGDIRKGRDVGALA